MKKRDESRRVVAQQTKLLSQVQVAMTPAEERIQAQKAKEAQLQKCADQKAKLLAELKQTETAYEKVEKITDKEFFSDTEVTSPKLPLIAKSSAKLAQIARSSAAANAGSFVEQKPEHIDLQKCLTLISERKQCNNGVK